ncbi:hypothetical protein [Aliterella atlantica]|uniref:Uncharacterized protein n=1 Tax=Aliterella atlantica CENA595 TaxID=1618023 RepID=A0A0D8ZQZ2_9CYAN|nr:hypothetical protein [Aliterella atlantica]KJH71203.1 hypothetical protein UH38_14460 [Aliterella atlantica CENA595]
MDLGMLYCRVNNLSSAAHHFEKYYSIRQSVSQHRQTKKGIIIDMGYEAFFKIEIEFVENFVRVISVDSVPELALHNGMPIMREYIRLADKINKPPFDREVSSNHFVPPYDFPRGN